MSIKSKRYLLILAISACSYATTILANDSLAEELIEIFKEQRQSLLKKQEEYARLIESDKGNLYELSRQYHEHAHYPLKVCEKYLRFLAKGNSTGDELTRLVQKFQDCNYAPGTDTLEAIYLQVIIVAIHFDLHKTNFIGGEIPENSGHLETAKRFIHYKSQHKISRDKAIITYVKARMYGDLAVEELSLTHEWAIALTEATNVCLIERGRNKTLVRFLKQEINKLYKFYQLNAVEIDKINEIQRQNETIKTILERLSVRVSHDD